MNKKSDGLALIGLLSDSVAEELKRNILDTRKNVNARMNHNNKYLLKPINP